MFEVMGRLTDTPGKEKCRKFTGLVGFYQTMSVITATLWQRYSVSRRRPSHDWGDTVATSSQWGVTLPKYSHLALLALLSVTACQAAPPPRQAAQSLAPAPVVEANPAIAQTGTASYYGKAHQGKRTADGSRFDQKALTAAHATLPFGTRIRVTLAGTDRSVVVVITDRLHSRTRILDLSKAAASQLGMLQQGIARVSLSPA
jgi:rare lipoprotein A